jgi:HPr kinase/phosphorylase
MTAAPKTIHGSAVLVGDRAVVIRGPSGSGKSRLAFDLILAGRTRQIPAARLLGDDRLELEAREGAVIARPAPALAGLIEIRGLGIRRCDHAAEGVVGLVVDLAVGDAARLPEPESFQTRLADTPVARIPVAAGYNPLPLVIAALTTEPHATGSMDCPQQMINHIRSTLATP